MYSYLISSPLKYIGTYKYIVNKDNRHIISTILKTNLDNKMSLM